jgi:hypothetical protein
MPKRKQVYRQKLPVKMPPVKKLLADVLSKQSAQPKVVVRRLVESDLDDQTTPCQSSKKTAANTSSSALKRVEEKVNKDNAGGGGGGTSPEPTLLTLPLSSATRMELQIQQSEQVRRNFLIWNSPTQII